MRAFNLIVPLALLALPVVAEATSIAPLTVEQMTDASTYIVRGHVTRVWTELDASGRVWTKAELSVSRTFKGPDEPATLVVDTIGGTFGEQSTRVDGMARFSLDEDVLLFLDSIHNGEDLTPVGAFTGKFTVKRPPHEARSIAVAYEVNPDVKFDARFLPPPPREEWVFVDDLEREVVDHLAVGWDGRAIPGLTVETLQRINTPARRIH